MTFLTARPAHSLRQQTIEVLGEGVPIGCAQCGRAAGVHAAATQLIHEVAHAQAFTDRVRRVKLAARIERLRALLDHRGGERDVGRDHEVARGDLAGDPAVRHVETAGDLHRADMRRTRYPQRLVGDQGQAHRGALGRTEQDLLDAARAGIGVHPNPHAVPFYKFATVAWRAIKPAAAYKDFQIVATHYVQSPLDTHTANRST